MMLDQKSSDYNEEEDFVQDLSSCEGEEEAVMDEIE